MPANRRRSAITAPYDRWVLLGSRLELRRRSLGYTWRTGFERERGVNKRLTADIEKAAKDRVNKFMPGSMQLIAQGYAVTYESVVAVLRGETDELVPVPVAPVPAGEGPLAPPVRVAPGETPPFDPARSERDRPWFDEINEQRVALAARGITDPAGPQMFPADPEAARAWDSIAAYGIPPGDRVWAIADLRRRAAARAGAPEANSHGA